MSEEFIDIYTPHDAIVMLVHIESQIRAARNLYQQAQNTTLTQDIDARYEILVELEDAGLALNKMKQSILFSMENRAYPMHVLRK